jgi:hypothetical protein
MPDYNQVKGRTELIVGSPMWLRLMAPTMRALGISHHDAPYQSGWGNKNREFFFEL